VANSNQITAAYSLLENHFQNLDACVAALELLSVLGERDLAKTVSAYRHHVKDADTLTNSQRALARLTLQCIKKSGADAIEQYSEIIKAMLYCPDDLLVYDALSVLYVHQTLSLTQDVIVVAYKELRTMLMEGTLDTENFLLVTALGALKGREKDVDRDLLFWLSRKWEYGADTISRAAVMILYGLITWEFEHTWKPDPEHFTSVDERLLKEQIKATDPLLSLASAIALCLRSDVTGLPVILAELIKPKCAIKLESLDEIVGDFSEEQILSEVLDLLTKENLKVTALLSVERQCSYCFNSENQEVSRLVCQAITNEKPKVREYGVRRALYCLSKDSDELMTLLQSTARYDTSPDVRAAAIEVIGDHYAQTLMPQPEPDDFCNFLVACVDSNDEPAEVRIGAARALAEMTAQLDRLKKLRNTMISLQ
jgi:hypothetical protein